MGRSRIQIASSERQQPDDLKGSAAVPVNTPATAPVTVCSGRSRLRARCYIVSVNNAVSAGGSDNIHFQLRVNGVAVAGYEDFQLQVGLTHDPTPLVDDINIPQNALVQLVAWNVSATTQYTATGRVQIEYENLV